MEHAAYCLVFILACAQINCWLMERSWKRKIQSYDDRTRANVKVQPRLTLSVYVSSLCIELSFGFSVQCYRRPRVRQTLSKRHCVGEAAVVEVQCRLTKVLVHTGIFVNCVIYLLYRPFNDPLSFDVTSDSCLLIFWPLFPCKLQSSKKGRWSPLADCLMFSFLLVSRSCAPNERNITFSSVAFMSK